MNTEKDREPLPPTILMGDDDEEDGQLVRQLMGEMHPEIEVYLVENGELLMDYMHRRGRYAQAQGFSLP